MTVIPLDTEDARRPPRSMLWERQVRPLAAALSDGAAPPPRALVVGTAGSGKSTTLRRLHEHLTSLGHRVRVAGHDAHEIAELSRDDVLVVDDLHLRDDDLVAAVHARAMDPSASLIVTLRPWPTTPTVQRITRELERGFPAVVLGNIGRSDLAQHLEDSGRDLPEACRTHILEITGGVSWLVSAALLAHDDRDCSDDERHTDLHRALQARVMHRMDTVDPELQRVVEELCIAGGGRPSTSGSSGQEIDGVDADELVRRGHAEGLLERSGSPLPIVRSAILASLPARRVAELAGTIAEGIARDAVADPDAGTWLDGLQDPGVGDALMRHGDQLADTFPERALDLWRRAEECGLTPELLVARRAEAHWALGHLDAAIALVDTSADAAADTRLTDVAAGVWAARGMMTHADAVYRGAPPTTPESTASATIAAAGIGSATAGATAHRPSQSRSLPSTLGVAVDLLGQGLAATLVSASEGPLADLVRAAEMYTSAQARGPITELPAVVAAVVALDLGATRTAEAVIDDAIRGGHGGRWARPRLLLWRAWVAVQRARPAEARRALDQASASTDRMSARDELLAAAVRVAIARRYEDASGLEAAWRRTRGALLRADIDLYLLHPLGELLSAAARVGDVGPVQRHLDRALEITSSLGDPPLWITHLRWAGIQQGILLGDPGLVAAHAKALVAASSEHHVAAVMARAGRVWTSVLAGRVDAEAVEAAAEGLASVGLAWDGARLAGHGAGRTDDRKVAARLLACARELHPTDGQRKSGAPEAASATDSTGPAPEELLSEREIEVARLVLQGKTYAEIGQAIFISPRTAEHHIAHIRHRLGATSRSDVIAKLRQLILEDRPDGGRGAAPEAAPPSTPLRASG